MDVESGPDADTPRPIGVGLLLCMLERGGEDVVQALLSLAQRMQVGGLQAAGRASKFSLETLSADWCVETSASGESGQAGQTYVCCLESYGAQGFGAGHTFCQHRTGW